MISFLRFFGVANAAIWLGASVFATFLAGPAFFSPEMLALFNGQRYFAGGAAQIFISRYFTLHLICVSVALIHLVLEKLYLNRQLTRMTVALWLVLATLTLSGFYVQPKMRELHHQMYTATPAQQAAAKKAFGLWHGCSQTANLVVVLALVGYFWRVTHPRRTWDASEI